MKELFMPAIGIIDDRKDHRTTLARAVSVSIPKEFEDVGWTVNDSSPLPNINDYSAWLTENDIAVLIVDEKLTEQTRAGVKHVTYEGHNIVDFLRRRIPDFPIYVVTAYPEESAVLARFKDVEEVFDRKTFTANAMKTVPRLIRAGQRYFDSFRQQLTELSELSKKIATGKETSADIARIKALQTFLQMPFITDPDTERSKSLSKLET
ncbi:MAG TPA: hypothetical protein VGE97_08320, partial [Nitrososphaera sp.]